MTCIKVGGGVEGNPKILCVSVVCTAWYVSMGMYGGQPSTVGIIPQEVFLLDLGQGLNN